MFIDVEFTSEISFVVSFASCIKSLPEFDPFNLYGKVFLTNFVELKSKDWSNMLVFSKLDLYEFPIKYGNLGTKVLVVNKLNC